MGLKDWLEKVMGDEDLEMEEETPVEDVEIMPHNETRKEVVESAPVNKRKDKVLNINATAQLKVVLAKPERFDDASSVADQLNSRRTVVLNLESTNKDVSRRILDFLSGVAYANNGQIKKVANCTFIITPYNVDIMGDLLDELENNGLYF